MQFQNKFLSMFHLVCLLLIITQAIGFFVAIQLLTLQKAELKQSQLTEVSSLPASEITEAMKDKKMTEGQIAYVYSDFVDTQPDLKQELEQSKITDVWNYRVENEDGEKIPGWIIQTTDQEADLEYGWIYLNEFSTYFVWENGWSELTANEQCRIEQISGNSNEFLFPKSIPGSLIILEQSCFYYSLPGTDEVVFTNKISLFDVLTGNKVRITDQSRLLEKIRSSLPAYENDHQFKDSLSNVDLNKTIYSTGIEDGSVYGNVVDYTPGTSMLLVGDAQGAEIQNYGYVAIDLVTGRITDSVLLYR